MVRRSLGAVKHRSRRVGRRGRVAAGAVVALGLLGAGINVYVGNNTIPVAGSTANLWVDTTGGTCTRQGTAGAYSDAGACSSIQTAVAACTAGDTIRMKAGTYGVQTVTTDRTTPGCDVIAENGTTIGDLTTHGNFFTLENVDVAGGWEISQAGVTDITLKNVDFDGSAAVFLDAEGYSNISWLGGSLSNFSCSSCSQGMAIYAGETVGGTSVVNNFLIDGVTFDNVDNTGGTGNHFEVIRVDGKVHNFTFRHSRIINSTASSSSIFFSTFRGNGPDDLVIENNYFADPVQAFFAVSGNFQNNACGTIALRYNTSPSAGLYPDATNNACTGASEITQTGNLAVIGGCNAATTTHNVWIAATSQNCGTGDTTITSASAAIDSTGHIANGSGAEAEGNPSSCPSDDFDSETRPQPAATTCDAGADERT